MYLKNQPFNNELPGSFDSMGIDAETRDLCKERIMFVTAANYLQAMDLYGDVENAPREMTTVSGDLKRCVSLIDDEKQYDATLLLFFDHHKLMCEVCRRHRLMNDPETSEEEKIKYKMIMNLEELKFQAQEMQEKERDVELGIKRHSKLFPGITPSLVLARIDAVKKSGYDFEKYLQILSKGLTRPDTNGIDDLLSKALKS